MKHATAAVGAIIAALSINSYCFAGQKHKGWGPPGLAKKGGVPPGLAKKGGLPPGIAKKYAIGQRIPTHAYQRVERRYYSRLPCNSPQGRKWVRVGRDLYLLSIATGTIVDVIQNWLD